MTPVLLDIPCAGEISDRALQSPKPTAMERLKEVQAWLERSTDRVLIIRDPDALPSLIEKELAT